MFSRMCEAIAAKLIATQQSVSVAESSTGGLIAANLLSVPGASSYFRGGSVIYTRESRYAFLDLDVIKLKGLKPLTEPMVAEFARAARLKLDATWGIAELGAAGPTGTPYGHAAGTSVIGISGPINASITVETFSENREENMVQFTEAALELFNTTLVQCLNSSSKA
jgi:nicotinamide-nucleotide amidase